MRQTETIDSLKEYLWHIAVQVTNEKESFARPNFPLGTGRFSFSLGSEDVSE